MDRLAASALGRDDVEPVAPVSAETGVTVMTLVAIRATTWFMIDMMTAFHPLMTDEFLASFRASPEHQLSILPGNILLRSPEVVNAVNQMKMRLADVLLKMKE